MGPERLNPRTDVVFKLLFTSSEALLIALLQAVLQPPRPIARAIVENPELPKDQLDDKGSILDILLTLDDGTFVDVEMQCSRRAGFPGRALYYWAKVFAGQLTPGHAHTSLAPVVSVLFLDYAAYPFIQFHERFQLLGERSHELFSPLLEIHTLELPKVAPAAIGTKPDALRSWCRFFVSNDALELAELAKHDPDIAMAEEHLAKLSANPHLRALARERERNEVGHRITLLAEREEGREEGRDEGRQEGRHQGSVVMFLKLVERRFGALNEAERGRLFRFSEAQLEAASAALFEANSVEDILLRGTGAE